MYYWDKVEEALKYIEKKTSVRPEAAVILGSGLGRAAESIEEPEIIPYEDIPYWPRSTAPGHAGRLVLGRLGGKRVAAMQGRVHYYEGYNMQEVTFPMRVLACLGVKALVATNASGGVNLDFRPGTIAAITDHINFMGINPLAGVNNDKWGVRFPDMTEAYDKKFIETLERAAREENIELKKGVYIASAARPSNARRGAHGAHHGRGHGRYVNRARGARRKPHGCPRTRNIMRRELCRRHHLRKAHPH